jgi:hypothetical protein
VDTRWIPSWSCDGGFADTELGEDVGVLALVEVAEGVAPQAAVGEGRRTFEDEVGAVEEVAGILGVLGHLGESGEGLERRRRPLPPAAAQRLHSRAFLARQDPVVLRLRHHAPARPRAERLRFRQARVHRLACDFRPVVRRRRAVHIVLPLDLRPRRRLRDLLALEEREVQRLSQLGFLIASAFTA